MCSALETDDENLHRLKYEDGTEKMNCLIFETHSSVMQINNMTIFDKLIREYKICFHERIEVHLIR